MNMSSDVMQPVLSDKGQKAGYVPQANPSYRLRIVTDVRDLASLEADWRDLEARVSEAFYFTSYDWCVSWWQWFGRHSGRGLGVLAIYDEAGLQAVVPLTTAKAWFFTSARVMGDDTGQYDDCLVAEERRGDEALRAAVADGLKALGVDRLTLTNCRADSALIQLLGAASGGKNANGHIGGGHNWVSAAEQINVEVRPDEFESYEAYIASRSSSLKKNLRRRRRNLGQLGELRCELVTKPDQMASIARQIVDLKLDWLAEYGLHGRFLARKGLDGWMAEIMTAAWRSGHLNLSVLWLDDKICAAQLAFQNRSKVIGYFSAFDLELSPYAVGKLHIEDQIADLFNDRLSLDLMPPDDDYKREWGVPATKVAAFSVPVTPFGAFVTSFYSVKTRTRAKEFYLKLPETLRAGAAANAIALVRWLKKSLVSLSSHGRKATHRTPTTPSLSVKAPKGIGHD